MKPTKLREYREYFQSISVSTENIKNKYGDLRCLDTWQRAYNDHQRPATLDPKEQVEFLEQCYIKSPSAEMAIVTPTKNFRPPFLRPITPVDESEERELTPEQLKQKSLIRESWGVEASENYQKFILSKKYGHLPMWHVFPEQDDWSNQARKLLTVKSQTRRQTIRTYSDYGNITPYSRRRRTTAMQQKGATKKRGRGISFAYTLPQLLGGIKTVTRRNWTEKYAQSMAKDWSEKLYPALSKSYCLGGKPVGIIELARPPYQEKLSDMPDSDVALEGFPSLSKQQFINCFFEGNAEAIVWVIRFQFTPTVEIQNVKTVSA